jgi:hypothetical protein
MLPLNQKSRGGRGPAQLALNITHITTDLLRPSMQTE